jgi:hypothetical protein
LPEGERLQSYLWICRLCDMHQRSCRS